MPVNYLNLADIDRAVNENQMAGLQRETLLSNLLRQKKADAEDEAYKNAFRGSIGADGNPDTNALYKRLVDSGQGPKAWEMRNTLNKQALEAQKAQQDVESSKYDAAAKKIAHFHDMFAQSKSNPQAWPQYKAYFMKEGMVGAESLPDVYDEAAVNENMMGAKDWIEQNKPKFERIDLGGNVVVKDVNPHSNPNILKDPLQKTLTPDQVENNRIQLRGQDLTSARAAEANALKADENAIRRGEKVPENSTALRKEFDDLPEVKNYKLARTAFKSIEDAVNRNTTASDINIVYGIAKLYDPTSVVREGEYATVANSPNIPERIKGLAQYLSNGGKLTPKVKQDIYAEAQSRIGAYENEYLPQRKNYEDIARRSNADPSLVFPSEFAPAIKPKSPKPPTKPSPQNLKNIITLPDGRKLGINAQGKAELVK